MLGSDVSVPRHGGGLSRARTTKRSGPLPTWAMLKVIGTLHRLLYRCSGGWMGGTLRGGPVLLLTTTGRKTGQKRTWPLCYLEDGDDLIVVASAGGAPRHPAWYLNLRAEPRVSLQLREESKAMVALPAEGSERAWLWERAVQRYPIVTNYQRKSGREIPVVVLRPETRQTPQGGQTWSRPHGAAFEALPHRVLSGQLEAVVGHEAPTARGGRA